MSGEQITSADGWEVVLLSDQCDPPLRLTRPLAAWLVDQQGEVVGLFPWDDQPWLSRTTIGDGTEPTWVDPAGIVYYFSGYQRAEEP